MTGVGLVVAGTAIALGAGVFLLLRHGWFGIRRCLVMRASSMLSPERLSVLVLRLVLVTNGWDAYAHGALGHVRLRQRRRLAALRCYMQAYALSVEPEARADYAYMAARVNGLLERPAEAGRLLVFALDINRKLAGRLHPDFAKVQREPDFRRRIGPAFDYGLDTEAV